MTRPRTSAPPSRGSIQIRKDAGRNRQRRGEPLVETIQLPAKTTESSRVRDLPFQWSWPTQVVPPFPLLPARPHVRSRTNGAFSIQNKPALKPSSEDWPHETRTRRQPRRARRKPADRPDGTPVARPYASLRLASRKLLISRASHRARPQDLQCERLMRDANSATRSG